MTERRLVITIHNIGYPAYSAYAPKITRKSPEESSRDQRKSNQPELEQNSDERNSSKEYQYKSAIDYKSNKIGINQVFTDFNNTLLSIGAPEEVQHEISNYINLASIQANKPKPSPAIIKSNLKTAGLLLDEYISVTLNKNSKVVSDWVDALLQQNIDYKASAAVPIMPQNVEFSRNISPQTEEPSEPVPNVQIESQQPSQITPKPVNEKLEKIYDKCAKQVDSGDYEKALSNYNKLLAMAKKADDKNVETKAYMDIAFIHDVNNDLPSALENYYNAATLAGQTGDYKTKAKAHYNMATIYDDLGKIDPAMVHYYCSLSYDGEVENLDGQALSLNSIGNLYTTQYDHKAGLDYYKIAYSLTKETDDKEGQAAILSNIAGVFRDLGYDEKSLKYYKNAIKLDMQTGNIEGYAKNFDQAGDIMLKKGQFDKAKNLYIRSMLAGQEAGDRAWQNRMNNKLESIS